jgi:alpha-beta hydrolase superfamily lysophospholipase
MVKVKATSFDETLTDGTVLFVHKWAPTQEPKGVVQIAHGMAEHSARYADFAATLANEGFIVYANDHRGHGKTAKEKEDVMYFADENGWELAVDDLHELTKVIKQENPDLPVFLFGHSMGSFLSRRYIQNYGEGLSGVILSGTGGDPGILGSIGVWVAKREIKKRGKKGKSKLLNKLSFGSYNKAFKPNRTEFDWLHKHI